MVGIIINALIFIYHDTYIRLDEIDREASIYYSALKEYEGELKEDITHIRSELSEKEAYLVSLDEELIELEQQYNMLLEENKRISDKLDKIKAGNVSQ